MQQQYKVDKLIIASSTETVKTPYDRRWRVKDYHPGTQDLLTLDEVCNTALNLFRVEHIINANWYSTNQLTKTWCNCAGVFWLLFYAKIDAAQLTPTFTELCNRFEIIGGEDKYYEWKLLTCHETAVN
jgi:hypothetical protein